MERDPKLRLLELTGSPFVQDRPLRTDSTWGESLDLLNYARLNKITLLYLDALKRANHLQKSCLLDEYENELSRFKEQQLTLVRVTDLFNTHGINYVVFKSLMPYPATPNDVDILHLGSQEEFRGAVEVLTRAGYERIDDASSPAEFEVHDARTHPHIGIRTKDVYDIDFYRRPAASYIVYLNRRKLARFSEDISVNGTRVKVLSPEAELVSLIAHSVIVEQILTLHLYYATLYYLADMNEGQVDSLVGIAGQNNVTGPLRTHFSIVSRLHSEVHGFVPDPVSHILSRLRKVDNREIQSLVQGGFKMPHKYSFWTVIRSLVERSKDGEFRAGALRQLLAMLNPAFASRVIGHLRWRRARETY